MTKFLSVPTSDGHAPKKNANEPHDRKTKNVSRPFFNCFFTSHRPDIPYMVLYMPLYHPRPLVQLQDGPCHLKTLLLAQKQQTCNFCGNIQKQHNCCCKVSYLISLPLCFSKIQHMLGLSKIVFFCLVMRQEIFIRNASAYALNPHEPHFDAHTWPKLVCRLRKELENPNNDFRPLRGAPKSRTF